MPRRKKNLRMPNGFGGIMYNGDGRRKPWRVRKTKGWKLVHKETGERLMPGTKLKPEELDDYKEVQMYLNIGTYETYEEALTALINYNQNPYDLAAEKITFGEAVERWADITLPSFADITAERYKGLIKRLPDSIVYVKAKDVKARDIECAIEEMQPTKNTARQLLTLFSYVCDYCMKHDICEKNYAKLIDLKTLPVKSGDTRVRNVLTKEEIAQIISASGLGADMIKVALFTGMRPGEIVTLKKDMINFEEGYIRHGLKTAAGKNRVIPIHPMILPVLKKNIKHPGEYVFLSEKRKQRYSYQGYRHLFIRLLPEHSPHDTRHTFITQWRSVLNLDENIGYLIFGHSYGNVSEKVYTHRDLEDLKAEMMKFHYNNSDIAMFKVI